MALHAQRHALDQRRAAALPRLLDRTLCLAVDGEHVGAVDDHPLEPVRSGAVGEVLDRELEVVRRRVRPLVVVADEDDGEPANAREVHPLVGVAARGRAVAVPGDRDPRLVLDPKGERRADGDRERGRQVRDHRDQAELQISHVHVPVAPLRAAVDPGEVVGEDPPGLEPARHMNAEIPVEGRTDVVGPHRRRDADRGALVAPARVERPGDLALPVEDVPALLDAARDQQIPVDAEQILAVEAPFRRLPSEPLGPATRAIDISRSL